MSLCNKPDAVERAPSHPKRVNVDRQVEVAVLAGRSTVERVDSPASSEPEADAHTVEGIENVDHLARCHEA